MRTPSLRGFPLRKSAEKPIPDGLPLVAVPAQLTERFFVRDADVVARDLLGRLLVHDSPAGRAALRITETEAYFGPPCTNRRFASREDAPAWLRERVWREGDPAAHSYRGMTPRNWPMFGPGGRAYVYLIYGMHECMNVTTGRDGDPQAVLLRGGVPVEGEDLMRARRGPRGALADGPGKLAKALGIARAFTGASMVEPGAALRFERAPRAEDALVTPRINVVGAEDYPLRFVVPPDPHARRWR